MLTHDEMMRQGRQQLGATCAAPQPPPGSQPALAVLGDGHARIARLLAELWQRTTPVSRPIPMQANSKPCAQSERPPTLRDFAMGSHRIADELESLLASLDI